MRQRQPAAYPASQRVLRLSYDESWGQWSGSRRPTTSKLSVHACLLKYGIRCVARLNIRVYREADIGDRAEPDLVVAFAGAQVVAPGFSQQLLEIARVTAHRAIIRVSRRRFSAFGAVG